jgi:tetratricopeptide (TPR) repeat protein
MGKASRRKKAVKEIESAGGSGSYQKFTGKSSRKRRAHETLPSRYYLATSVAFITFVVYLAALRNGFVSWDDSTYVYTNSHIRSFNLTFLRWAFLDFYASNWHPLTWISHALDYAVWGLKPWGHHLTSIFLHAVNTFILIFLVIRLLERAKETTNSSEHPSFLNGRTIAVTAGVTGLLFGLHPLHVESVAWVAERKDLISALFYLLSITVYVRSEEAGTGENMAERSALRFFNRRHIPSLCFFILALLGKPMAVTLPVVLLILDWYPLKRIQSPGTFGVALFEKLPFIVLSIVSSILTILAQKAGMAFALMKIVPLSTRVFVAARALMVYLGKVIFPFHLVPFYPYPENFSPAPTDYLMAIIPLIAITAVCAALSRKQKVWLAVWGCYVVTLLPVLGIIQVGRQAMADRYMYLPSVGPLLLLGLLSAWVSAKINALARWRKVSKFLTAAIAVLVLASLSYLTVKQIGVWRNDLGLWTYVIEKEPNAYLAYYIRSFTYRGKGQLDRAMEDSNKAIALNPSYWASYQNRAAILERRGLFDKAMADYDKAIALNPSYARLYYERGALFEKMGQSDSAAADYDKVIALDPSLYEAYYKRGVLSLRGGARDQALSFFSQAITANHDYERAYLSRGALFSLLGQEEKALNDLNNAILLNERDAAAYFERGNVYLRSGRKELALPDFRKACNLGNKDGCNSLLKLQGAVIDIDGAPFRGSDKAKLVLVEFSDYQ